MIESYIKIGSGSIENFYQKWGFIYLDADERTAPDEKEDEMTSYAEESGEHRDGRVVDAPFDYTAKFLIEAPNRDLANVNVVIDTFNQTIREHSQGSDVKRKVEIAFYNILNRVKIVGYPDVVAVPTKVYHSNVLGDIDYAQVELKIRVSEPAKCDFTLNTDNFRAESQTMVTADD